MRLTQGRRLAYALGFRDFPDALECRRRVVLGESEHRLHDARDRFSVAVADGQQAQVIALAHERLADVEVPARDDVAPAQGQQVDEDQQGFEEKQRGQRDHENAARNEHTPERAGAGVGRSARRLRHQRQREVRLEGKSQAGEQVHAEVKRGHCTFPARRCKPRDGGSGSV